MAGPGPIGADAGDRGGEPSLPSWRPQGRHPRLVARIPAKGVDCGPSPTMTMKTRRRPVSTRLRFTVGDRDGEPSLPSWRPQGRHPRLAVLISAKGVDGGPSPTMTMKARRRPVSTRLRFTVGDPGGEPSLPSWRPQG